MARVENDDVRGDYRGSDPCSLANTLDIVGERWAFFILREALVGTTRYAEFRSALGIASDVLADRLRTLVEAGVMEKRGYREPGQRARESYHLTESGRRLGLVLAAMQQWGDEYVPSAYPPTVAFVTGEGSTVHASFVSADGTAVPQDEVRLERTASHPVR
ncbi:transcriptional regulator [Rubrobacter tropicus]|uniref:Transcriptional regulator n=1 Tax=Rubrobacter tropicus TaxID=2653851 RepID=A0A6G8QCM3_9ACTN|nr:helix-turn-helix domain-containing protein [Rubrobacter tropicus]QIN84236.1 transcriptional regulator [Rubrobacter tropicus]